MHRRLAWLLLLLAGNAWASQASDPPPAPQAPADNVALKKIFDEDQADRLGPAFRTEPEAVMARDGQRRDAALQMVKDGRLRTARDYFAAAMIFQHSADDIALAHSLATIARYLDPQNKQYRWLMAASWDRMLMQRVQPQWYGTQYQSDDQGLFLFPVADGAVTDTERTEMGVPSLEESHARLAEMASMTGNPPRTRPPTIEELRNQSRPGPGEVPPASVPDKTEE